MVSASSNKVLQQSTAFKFLMGSGSGTTTNEGYKICYSDSGSFSGNNVDVWPATIHVAGVYDDTCTSSNCL